MDTGRFDVVGSKGLQTPLFILVGRGLLLVRFTVGLSPIVLSLCTIVKAQQEKSLLPTDVHVLAGSPIITLSN